MNFNLNILLGFIKIALLIPTTTCDTNVLNVNSSEYIFINVSNDVENSITDIFNLINLPSSFLNTSELSKEMEIYISLKNTVDITYKVFKDLVALVNNFTNVSNTLVPDTINAIYKKKLLSDTKIENIIKNQFVYYIPLITRTTEDLYDLSLEFVRNFVNKVDSLTLNDIIVTNNESNGVFVKDQHTLQKNADKDNLFGSTENFDIKQNDSRKAMDNIKTIYDHVTPSFRRTLVKNVRYLKQPMQKKLPYAADIFTGKLIQDYLDVVYKIVEPKNTPSTTPKPTKTLYFDEMLGETIAISLKHMFYTTKVAASKRNVLFSHRSKIPQATTVDSLFVNHFFDYVSGEDLAKRQGVTPIASRKNTKRRLDINKRKKPIHFNDDDISEIAAAVFNKKKLKKLVHHKQIQIGGKHFKKIKKKISSGKKTKRKHKGNKN